MESLLALAQAFAQVLTPVLRVIVWLFPLKVYWLHDGERGVVCTFGRVRGWRRAERGPGISFAGPFEELHSTQARGRYLDVDDQELSLVDGRIVGVSTAIVFDIRNVQAALLEISDCDDFIAGMLMDMLRQHARTVTWEKLTDSETTMKTITSGMNRRLSKHGCYVQSAWLTDWRIDPTQMICDVVRETAGRLLDGGAGGKL